MPIPKLVAHRGYTLRYPENTLPAVQGAIHAGAKFVEVDVQMSRDKVPFLFHDKTLRRICNQPGSMRDYSAEQLKTFTAADTARFGDRFKAVRLATVDEFAQCLERHPDVTAFVEVKKVSIKAFGSATILRELRKALEPVFMRCVLLSFDIDTLELAQNSGWSRIGAVINHWHDRERAQIKALQPDWLYCDVHGLPGRGSLALNETRLVIYEVDQVDTALALAARGVNFIETFAFAELHRGLAETT